MHLCKNSTAMKKITKKFSLSAFPQCQDELSFYE